MWALEAQEKLNEMQRCYVIMWLSHYLLVISFSYKFISLEGWKELSIGSKLKSSVVLTSLGFQTLVNLQSRRGPVLITCRWFYHLRCSRHFGFQTRVNFTILMWSSPYNLSVILYWFISVNFLIGSPLLHLSCRAWDIAPLAILWVYGKKEIGVFEGLENDSVHFRNNFLFVVSFGAPIKFVFV